MKQIIILLIISLNVFSIFGQNDTSNFIYKKNRIESNARLRADTMRFKSDAVRFRNDSIRFPIRFKAEQRVKIGMRKKLDSATYKPHPPFNFVYDYPDKDTLTKEVTTEVACNPDATIFIENLNRKLIIKTSTDNKVKITTTVNYSVDPKWTDDEWFQKINIELKSNNNQVVLKSDNIKNGNEKIPRTFTATEQTTGGGLRMLQYSYGNNTIKEINTNSIALFDGDGNWVNKRNNIQHIVTVYIPKGAKLAVESKYADVEIQNDLKGLKADITNASLRFMNTDNADIQGKYVRINAGSIKKADITITNGKFYAKDIYSGKFDSKYSNIEFGVSNDLNIQSVNDQYEIDEVTDLKANKNYGNVRITNLKNSFNLTGNNADIKIRDIGAGISDIKIDDKYADIRLPLNNVANYSVDFDGKNCNVYAPFEKIEVVKIEDPKPKEPQQTKQPDEMKIGLKPLGPLTFTKNGSLMNAKDNAFKASVGDTKGKHAQLQFKCNNCTVDFK